MVQAEYTVRREAPDNALLAGAVRELVACLTEDAVFDVLGDFAHKLVPDAIVVVNRTTEDCRYLVTRDLIGLPDGGASRLVRTMGLDPVGHSWEITDAYRADYFAPTLMRVPDGFVQYMADLLPAFVAKAAAKALGIHDVYTIGIAHGESMLGNVSFLMRTQDAEIPAHVIESFVYPCFVTLERIRANRQLAETARSYRMLTESISDVVWTLDPDTMRYLYLSPSVLRLRGFTAEEALGQEFVERVRPADAEGILALIHAHRAALEAGQEPEGTDFAIEFEQTRRDQSTVHVEAVVSFYRNEDSGRLESGE